MAKETDKEIEQYNEDVDKFNEEVGRTNSLWSRLCAPASPHTDGLLKPPLDEGIGSLSDEYKRLADAESQRRKETPIFTGLICYWPDALEAVASHSYVNNEKHNPGETLHWSRDKSNDHLDSLARHLTDLGKLTLPLHNPEKIELLKAIVWRGLAELQLTIEDAESTLSYWDGEDRICEKGGDPSYSEPQAIAVRACYDDGSSDAKR